KSLCPRSMLLFPSLSLLLLSAYCLLLSAYCLLPTAFFLRSGLGHVAVELTRGMRVLELNGGVVDSKPGGEEFADEVRDLFRLRCRHIEDQNMAGKRARFRTQTPDVDVVDLADAGDFEDGAGHGFKPNSFGQAFKQDVGGIGEDFDGAPQDQAGDQKGDQR